MSSQVQKPQVEKARERKRGIWTNPFVIIIILLLIILIIISTLLIISSLGIISLKWFNNLSAVFVGIILPVLAIIVTLAQWLHSLSSHKEDTSPISPHNHSAFLEFNATSSKLLEQSASDDVARSAGFMQSAQYSIPEEHNKHHVDWGEAPDAGQFYGRDKELTELKRWVMEDRCKVIAVLGMGGIGKTSLVVKVVDQAQEDFEYIFWRSVQNAPPLKHILQSCIQFVSDQKQINLPEGIDDQILLLIEHLRNHRCLLILDNCESILQGGNQAGLYQDGYEDYGTLIRHIGDIRHQSCLIITSREKPREVALMEGNTSPVRVHQLEGLNPDEGREILKDKGLVGTEHSWDLLVEHYSGNPLALKLVSQFIQEVFNGNIESFLQKGEKFFNDISDVLEQQFGRLSALEKDIMYWLAIEREAVALNELREDMLLLVTMRELQEAQRSLLRRNMIIVSDMGITLQNVVMEYVTDRFVDRICEDIKNEVPGLLRTHAIMKAQTKDYVRESQLRLILTPIAQRLIVLLKREGFEGKCKGIIYALRQKNTQDTGYIAGNLLNLLAQMGYDLRGYDFSHLTVRQAYLQNVVLPEVNLAYADLAASIFRDAFDTILSLVFSPKGDLLAAGMTSGEVRIWNVLNDELVLKYQWHIGWVNSIAYNPDGNVLASASRDQTIRLCEMRTGRCLLVIRGYPQSIRSMAFSSDGQTLVSVGDDPAIWVWNVDTGDCLKKLQGHSNGIRSVAFSSDGNLLVSGSTDGTIRIWDVNTGECRRVLQGHNDVVRSVTFSFDGKLIASGGYDRIVCLWEVSTGERLQVFDDYTDKIRSVAFNPEGTILASGGNDQSVRLWEVKTGLCIKILQGYTNWINSVAFSPAGRILASGSDDHAITLWDFLLGESINLLKGHTNRIWSIAFSRDGHVLASGSQDKTICLWMVSTGSCFRILQEHNSTTLSLAFTPDGMILASGSEDSNIYLWSTESGKCLKVLRGHNDAIRSIAFTPDGMILASGSSDSNIYLWSTESRKCLKVLRGHNDEIRGLTFISNGQILVSGSYDRTIRLWDINSGECINSIQEHTRSVVALAFDTRRSVLASASYDQSIRLWNIDNYQSVQLLQEHNGQFRSIAFSPDGDILASGSSDGTIKLWDASSGAHIRTLVPDRPYDRMDITGVTGLTEDQKSTLRILGAIER